MPLFIPVIALLAAGGLGFLWWEKTHVSPPRSITLDSGLSDTEKQTIIAAIMTATDPNQLDAMSAQYKGYPYASYELSYRAWELRGSKGAPPSPPQGPGMNVNLGPQGASVSAQTGPLTGAPADLAQQAASAAQSALAALGGLVPVDPGVAAASASSTAGSWTPVPDGAASLFNWNSSPIMTPAVAAEAARLLAANLQGSVIERYSDGTTWRFTNNGTAVIAASGSPKGDTGQQAGADPMGMHPPFSSEYHEDVAGLPGEQREEVSGVAPGESREEVGYSPDKVDTFGERDAFARGAEASRREDVAGVPDHVGGALAQGAVTAAMTGAVPMTVDRPKGGWFIRVRPIDKIWPRSIVRIGSGVSGGVQGGLQHLSDINPHLSQGGVIRQFVPGDEVNVPAAWVPQLKAKGLEVDHDD
jgi:hypothetical protein